MFLPLPAPRRSRRLCPAPFAWLPLAAGLALAFGVVPLAWAQSTAAALPAPALTTPAQSRPGKVNPQPPIDGSSDSPVQLTAREVHSQLNQETQALGDVELRRGGLLLTSDTLRYLQAQRLVMASGQVRLSSGGDMFNGEQAQLLLDSHTGYVTEPTYYFARTAAGGNARRIDFTGPQQLTAYNANYSSCTREADGEPGWELRMDKLDLDFDANEGKATGAVLRFLGVPILALPSMSFPTSDAAKSGWLPPTIDFFDSRGGFGFSVPYYWRFAPNYDLMLTPVLSSRRGTALRSEFRYLQPNDSGRLELHWVPEDRTTDTRRYSVQAEHEGALDNGVRYELAYEDASDDRYWKDFSRLLPSLAPRLLPQQAGVWRSWAVDQGNLSVYARVQDWRVLQDVDTPIEVPYQRAPQIGARLSNVGWQSLRFDLETEANRFTLNDRAAGDTRPQGSRVHALGAVARPYDFGWGWLTPRLAVNAAAYDTDEPMTDGRTRAHRVIPTASIDGGLRFERDSTWFGTRFVQTLEPRLHYLNTPTHGQDALPLFDTAASDFNSLSIYADNEFTGIDRVSDAHQITLGASTRWIEPDTGVERFSLGAAQRFQFRDQKLTADGQASDNHVSDLLVFAAGRLGQDWRTDTTLQYNPDLGRTVRSIISMRYNPAPFHTLAGTYRYSRGLSEQFELGYQWPLFSGKGAQTADGSCQGTLYGVGRVNYSLKDHRTTDSIVGLEYDAGCWIARVVAERVSTGQSEATKRLMIQLELVGLSRLGSNPLQVLKDNIPGYRLLRDDNAAPPSTVNP